MLVKIYGQPRDGAARYSPPECIGTQTHHIQGMPDPTHISTSYAERQNLTMWMAMRRFTRLTHYLHWILLLQFLVEVYTPY